MKNIKLRQWREKIGVVPQEITLFSGNVIDNIVMDREKSPQSVIDFCTQIGFNKVFESFPQGYYTLLGEEGVNISGGQKQILALARALFKNPDFLILDEATGALDRKTKELVLTLLQELKKEISILVITHRLHFLKSIADSIYILENQKIESSGTHKELLQSQNLYSDFWENFK